MKGVFTLLLDERLPSLRGQRGIERLGHRLVVVPFQCQIVLYSLLVLVEET